MADKWEGLEEWFEWADGLADEIFEEVSDYVEKTAYKIEADAKKNAPVDTGRLRSSIDTDVERDSKSIKAEIGTDVEYAETIEYGSSKQKAQPYMNPSFNKNANKFQDEIKKIIDKEMG